GVWTGQEAGAHAIGHFAESQIEACGLDLVGDEVIGGQNGAIPRERRDHVVRQDAFFVDCKGERHDVKSPMTPDRLAAWARLPHLNWDPTQPMTVLTKRPGSRSIIVTPWSFGPAGVQPRQTNR